MSFTLPDNAKAVDDTSENQNFGNSADFTIDPIEKITTRDESYSAEEIGFLHKNIYNYFQISFTLKHNTKAADDKSANYSFVNSVDATRDSVDKIALTHESYPLHKINFVDKDIDD